VGTVLLGKKKKKCADRQPGNAAGWARQTGGKTKQKKKTFYESFTAALERGKRLSKNPASRSRADSPGLVNCKEISNFLVRLGCEAVFENGPHRGVNTRRSNWPKPASSIIVNEEHLAFQEGVAMQLPVKVHLGKPAAREHLLHRFRPAPPLIWNLTTGKNENRRRAPNRSPDRPGNWNSSKVA